LIGLGAKRGVICNSIWVMNRLIIIGNGFDLAHGMKTSYNDFMKWYVRTSFETASKTLRYNDPLFSIVLNPWVSNCGLSLNTLADYFQFTIPKIVRLFNCRFKKKLKSI
jgi:hypothetical protein